MNRRINLTLFVLFCCSFISISGQMNRYGYMREIEGINEQWHKIIIPNTIFSRLNADFSDMRIYGINSQNDTIETPYILKVNINKNSIKTMYFKTINTVKNANGYFFTFESDNPESINQITLNFGQRNFDWKLNLEGSQDGIEWFRIVENYRILSIKNNSEDYKFTRIDFPEAKYKFYRINFPSVDVKPELINAGFTHESVSEGVSVPYGIKSLNTRNNIKLKQTEIDVILENALPVNRVNIKMKEHFDYHRPLSVRYGKDSIVTADGSVKYTYSNSKNGTLSSLDKNEFTLENAVIRHLKIIIENGDNPTLSLDEVNVFGSQYELIVRFTEPAGYYLVYGNEDERKPNYDIEKFTGKIPENLTVLKLGNEQLLNQAVMITDKPLFENPVWLWGTMVLIIFILGWFSLKMLREKKEEAE